MCILIKLELLLLNFGEEIRVSVEEVVCIFKNHLGAAELWQVDFIPHSNCNWDGGSALKIKMFTLFLGALPI